jgi:hypothetical protein
MGADIVRIGKIHPTFVYAGTRYVDLGQINPGNAAQLRPVCIYQAADMGRFLNNPLVYRGVMYITTAQSTIALDAATCVVKWRFDWKAKAKEGQMAGVGSVYRSRGVALKDGRLVRSTADGFLIALDVQTGQVVWERAVVDAEKFEILGMAPLVVEDLVIVGAGISEFGVKGWIGAFRLQDGAPVWRFNTVPDANEPGSAEMPSAAPMDDFGFPRLNSGTGIQGAPTTGGLSSFFFGGQGGFSAFGDGLNVGRCNCPLTESEQQVQFVNNWTKSQGNHTIKFGADIRYALNLRVPSDANRTGELNFNAGDTSDTGQKGLSLATFLLGDVTFFQRFVSSSLNAASRGAPTIAAAGSLRCAGS